MWKFSDISLFQVSRVFSPVWICAPFNWKRRRGVRFLTWPVFTCIVVALFLSTPSPAYAQQQSINVLTRIIHGAA